MDWIQFLCPDHSVQIITSSYISPIFSLILFSHKKPSYSKWSHFFRFSNENSVHICFVHGHYMSSASHSARFDHPKQHYAMCTNHKNSYHIISSFLLCVYVKQLQDILYSTIMWNLHLCLPSVIIIVCYILTDSWFKWTVKK